MVVIVTGIAGQKFWTTEVFTINNFTFHLNEIGLLGVTIFSIFTAIYSFVNIFKHNARKALNSLTNLIPNLFLTASLFTVFSLKHEGDIVDSNPKVVIYLYGLMFAKMLLHLMMSHIAHKEYEWFSSTIFGTSLTLIVISVWNSTVEYER